MVMKLPEMANPPAALDPNVTYRENMIEADVESLERMRKVAHVQGFEVYCHVTMRNKSEGSALQGTVQANCLGFESKLELESDESPERIQQLLRNAEHG